MTHTITQPINPRIHASLGTAGFGGPSTPGLTPAGLDPPLEPLVPFLIALLGNLLVVDVGRLDVEVGAHPAGELHGLLGNRADPALHLELRQDREETALDEHALAAFGQQELD